jgi:ATP-dependent DNA ligase
VPFGREHNINVHRIANLEKLCEACADPNQSVSQEIVPGQQCMLQRCKHPLAGKLKSGKSVTPAQQVATLADKILRGNEAGDFVVECKWDGWRVSAHIPDIDDEASARCALA